MQQQPRPASPRPAPALPTATIVKRRDVTHDLFVIWLEPEVAFTFKPGQYVTIGLQGIERAYSIVSSPHEPLIELFVELVPPPDGNLTPLLWKAKVGDKVTIRPRAKGIFTFEEKYPNHLLVATVTGIAPFMSMVRQYIHQGLGSHRFYILHGASYQDEFTYKDELEKIAAQNSKNFTYVTTISRPTEERNKGWKGETGRVNLIVERYIEKFGLKPDSTLVYACGHPGMIEDVKERLTPKGFRVKEERYWKQ